MRSPANRTIVASFLVAGMLACFPGGCSKDEAKKASAPAEPSLVAPQGRPTPKAVDKPAPGAGHAESAGTSEEERARFVERVGKRLVSLSQRLTDADEKVKGMGAQASEQWAQVRTTLADKLSGAKKDLEEFKNATTDEARRDSRRRIRSAVHTVDQALDAVDVASMVTGKQGGAKDGSAPDVTPPPKPTSPTDDSVPAET